jgi:hypothetical protein
MARVQSLCDLVLGLHCVASAEKGFSQIDGSLNHRMFTVLRFVLLKEAYKDVHMCSLSCTNNSLYTLEKWLQSGDSVAWILGHLLHHLLQSHCNSPSMSSDEIQYKVIEGLSLQFF